MERDTFVKSTQDQKTLFLGSGVIDSDYRGSISVILTNFSSWSEKKKSRIKKGDRFAQINYFKEEEVDFDDIDEFDDSTSRGTKSFG